MFEIFHNKIKNRGVLNTSSQTELPDMLCTPLRRERVPGVAARLERTLLASLGPTGTRHSRKISVQGTE